MRKTSVLFLFPVLLAGCGKPAPPPIVEVEGLIRLDGSPLKGVEVRFVPTTDYGPEYTATGLTDDTGRFRLTCDALKSRAADLCKAISGPDDRQPGAE